MLSSPNGLQISLAFIWYQMMCAFLCEWAHQNCYQEKQLKWPSTRYVWFINQMISTEILAPYKIVRLFRNANWSIHLKKATF